MLSTPIAAHPHIFINTGIEVLVDAQNRVTHLKVTWEYDELYSLLVTEDMGLDDDYDGTLTEAEIARLTGFDMNWIEGFNGDLEATLGNVPVRLSGPKNVTASFDDGKITTTHLRAVEETPSLDASTLNILPYDATYYTAYEVSLPVSVTREGCEAVVSPPDIDAALALTQAELAQLPPDVEADEAGYPKIGKRFATLVQVTCPAS
ncbi:DUF1007 domain-containing protein [Sulfitobacter sp. SK012]|nr:DUF1007 domain-containing protein [Sulfitobacter sp. SK012]